MEKADPKCAGTSVCSVPVGSSQHSMDLILSNFPLVRISGPGSSDAWVFMGHIWSEDTIAIDPRVRMSDQARASTAGF
jgi:hypothetical protein